MNDEKRNFTDADIKAMVAELKSEFFNNFGRGVWGFAWKGIVIFLIIVSLYGASKGVDMRQK
jgi:hypothetical protein